MDLGQLMSERGLAGTRVADDRNAHGCSGDGRRKSPGGSTSTAHTNYGTRAHVRHGRIGRYWSRQGQSGRIRIDYCADQVAPPFSVVKLRPSSSVTVALLGLEARTTVIMPSAGGVAPNQPFFVRRRTNPFSPTSHATSALTSAPARTGRSAVCSATQVAAPIARRDKRGERRAASRSLRRAASTAAHSAQPARCRSTAIASRGNNVPSWYPTSRAGSGHMR